MKNRQLDKGQFTDGEVWNLFRAGDEAAFEYLYRQYFDQLYNYGCQFTKDHSLVEDVIQEFFLELRRRSRFLSPTDKILPYLYSGFRRKIIRARTKRSKFKALDIRQSFSLVGNIEDEIIEDEEKRTNQEKLHRAIESLSERHREMIFLFYYENLSYEEIKEIQEFENVKSARNLLYKALQALRKDMKVFFISFIGLLVVLSKSQVN